MGICCSDSPDAGERRASDASVPTGVVPSAISGERDAASGGRLDGAERGGALQRRRAPAEAVPAASARFSLAALNERLRKTLSLDSRKARPVSCVAPDDDRRFRPKSVFSLEALFRGGDDFRSSKYKKFDSESSDAGDRDATPDLLDLPFITGRPKKTDSDSTLILDSESSRAVGVRARPVRPDPAKSMDKSIDSIGSCSLDVDASTDFSDTTSGSLNILTPSSATSRVKDFTSRLQERATGVTRLSHTPPSEDTLNGTGRILKRSPGQRKFAEEEREKSSCLEEIRENRLPSYLRLACSVSGYTPLTAYDSRFHNMDTTIRNSKADFLSKMTAGDGADVPDNVPTNPASLIYKSNYSETTITSGKLLTNGKSRYEAYLTSKSESYTNSTNKHSTNGLTSYSEIRCEDDKSFPSKSFIRQRVERLYGPGALAQGFLKVGVRRQAESNGRGFTESEDFHQTQLGPSLPVLRHLRPEFRAQLPISPKRSPAKSTIEHLEKFIPISIADSSSQKIEINGVAERIVPLEIGTTKSDTEDTTLKVNGRHDQGDVTPLNNITEEAHKLRFNEERPPELNGHHFLALKRQHTDRLLAMGAEADGYLEELQGKEVSEEITGMLRSASGKARLLATQKMMQFEGLCHKNISIQPGDAFPTTIEDLQGFWDMVMLQVNNVDALFVTVRSAKNSNWKEIPSPSNSVTGVPTQATNGANNRTSARPARPRSSVQPTNEKAKLAAHKREADRKAMLENRRKLARERQLAAQSSTTREDSCDVDPQIPKEVEIFVAGLKSTNSQGEECPEVSKSSKMNGTSQPQQTFDDVSSAAVEVESQKNGHAR